MDGREKLISGEMTMSRDKEQVKAYVRCRRLLQTYNAMDVGKSRRKVLKKLLGKVGKQVTIEAPFYCDYGENISIGDNSFLNFGCILLDCSTITIGRCVLIGPGVQMLTPMHPMAPVLRKKRSKTGDFATYAQPIVIHDNVWIGGGAILLPGITVGEDAVIGAGSVVTKDVPPGAVVAGNPSRMIREG